jgi:hypothetical protein
MKKILLMFVLCLCVSIPANAKENATLGIGTDSFIKKFNSKLTAIGVSQQAYKTGRLKLKDGYIDLAHFGKSINLKFIGIDGKHINSVSITVDNGDQSDSTRNELLLCFGVMETLISPELNAEGRASIVNEIVKPGSSFPINNKMMVKNIEYGFYKGMIADKFTTALGAQAK